MVKNLPVIATRCRRHGFNPWVRRIPWSRKWQPTPIFLPGKSHRQTSLVGYRPSGCKESDTTKRICTRKHTHTHTHTHTHRRLEACSDISSICLLHVTSCLNDYPSLLPVQSCSPPTPPPETPACSLSILEGLPTAC